MSRSERRQSVPMELKHKPIFVINRNDQTNGFYKNENDVIGLSLGKSQWSDTSFVPSVKVWRDVYDEDAKGYKISRQSGETTLTRALDLAYLVVRVYDGVVNGGSNGFKNIENNCDGLSIAMVGDQGLLQALQSFLNKENTEEIKKHIAMLKKAILNIRE